MASLDPRIRQLQLLVEKQMKSQLHVRFLENCKTENVIPKGLQLKLKVSVGRDTTELQKSVDDLLFKVSRDICDRVRDDHLRRSHEYSCLVEKTRNEIKNALTDDELITVDSNIFEQTERTKTILVVKHNKKINYLKKSANNEQHDTIIIDDEEDTNNINQPEQSTDKRKETTRKPRKQKPPRRRTPNNTSVRNEPIIDKESKINQRSSVLPPEGSNPKNETAPGTKKTYKEAVVNGAQKPAINQDLQQTLQTLSQVVQNLLTVTTAINRNVNEDSSEYQTKRLGEKTRGGYRRYREEKRRY